MVATVGSIAVAFGADLRAYEASLRKGEKVTSDFERRAGKSVRGTNAALASLDRQATLTGVTLARTFAAGLAGGIFAGGAAGLVGGIRRINAEMAKLSDTAKIVGVNVEDLQRLRFGFEQTGVSVGDLDTGMRRFARRIGEAANGGGQLHAVLEANNVQLRNADGTMRSQVELLRDYANLIRNAGSHQERLALAFKAFDVGGAAMVDALKDGAAGLDTLMDKIDEAGGVIDEKLVQEAARLDTEFGILWRNFETFAKRAIINVSVTLRNGLFADINAMGAALRDMVNDPSLHNAGRLLFGDRFMGDEAANNIAAIERRIKTLTDQVQNLKDLGFDATEAERELAQARAQLEQEVAKIMSGGGGEITLPPIDVNSTPTIIPGGGDDDSGSRRAGSRNRAAEAANREMEAVNALIDSLAHELSLVGASDVERDRANALRQAGAAATEEQRQRIEELVTALHEEAEAHRQVEEAARQRNEMLRAGASAAVDAFMSIIDGSKSAGEAIKDLVKQIAAMILRMLLMKMIMGALGLNGGGGVGTFPAAPGGVSLHNLAGGGRVFGPGTATSDSIPAMLSNGEYVIRAKQVQKYGPLIEAINEDKLSQFASGGRVGAAHLMAMTDSMIPSFSDGGIVDRVAAGAANIKAGGRSDETVNININVEGARGNREIEEMVASGVQKGIAGYDKTRQKRYQNGAQFG